MKLFLSLLAILVALPASAEISSNAKYEFNKKMGPVAFKYQLGTLLEGAESVADTTVTYQGADGTNLKRVARATYSVATNGGTIGAHALGVYLPAKAIIVRSYFQVLTQFVDAGSGTVALSCEDANNIKTATDITGSSAGAFVEGASTGAASAFVGNIAANCQITATVAGADQTDGKLVVFVEYVVSQ